MIPLFAPSRQNDALMNELQSKVSEVLRSGIFMLGPEVDALERSLAERTGYAHAIGVANGTDAIVLALKACGLQPGDEVITPAFSFVASASAVVWAGFKPVFCDVSLDTCNVTLETVQAALTPRTRAIVAVDLYGRQAPIAELRRFCDRQGLFLIEDGAQSIGVPKGGAHAYTTSFYPTKNLGALGDGGAVMTDDGDVATRVKEMRVHGGLQRDHYVRVGTTGRLDALQAAVLNVKLPHLQGWTATRRTLAGWYLTHLRKYEDAGRVTLPRAPETPTTHVWALFTLRINGNRNALLNELKHAGVGAAVYYPKALHQQPALQNYATKRYPNSERLASEVISLPLFPELSGKEFDGVVKAFGEAMGRSVPPPLNPRSPERDRPNVSA